MINPAERNALVGIKPTVGLTSRAGYAISDGKRSNYLYYSSLTDRGYSVIPECTHQDTVGTLARTVRDAVYALDAIYGIDPLDNYTRAQEGKTPQAGYAQYLTSKDALKNATFGLPWQSFWALADPVQQAALLEIVNDIQSAGATIINGTELKDYETIVSPDGWNW